MHTRECRECAKSYDDEAWRGLPLVERAGPDDLRDLFTDWPWSREAVLEIRRCACGSQLAHLDQSTSIESRPTRSSPSPAIEAPYSTTRALSLTSSVTS